MTALALGMGSIGNIRTQTMRAFSAEEIEKILSKLPSTSFFSGTNAR
jgi:uncharacterized protein with GYD domain